MGHSRVERVIQMCAWLATVVIAVMTVGDVVGAWDVFKKLAEVDDVSEDIDDVREAAALNSLGTCERSMEVKVGQSCLFVTDPRSGAIAEFRVVGVGAYPPGSTSLRPGTVKVDWDGVERTFQAVELEDGSGTWRIEAAGEWIDIHDGTAYCTKGDALGPGQFCIERATGAQFRVYGSDQLNPDDVQRSFDHGYAVLYWFARGTPSVDNGLLGLDLVALRCPEGDSPFIAQLTVDAQWWVVERADGEASVVCPQQAIEERESPSSKGSTKN